MSIGLAAPVSCPMLLDVILRFYAMDTEPISRYLLILQNSI